MNQAEEIVSRNEGDINDLINHINQEIRVSTIINKKLDDGLYKNFIQEKTKQLLTIKSELQQALIKYQKAKELIK